MYAFRELNEHAPLLVEHRLESATLGDFEQRSYWIEITQQRVVALEAAGRNLADLRLWRDGTWLVDAQPKMSQSLARPEKPLAVARLTVDLAPGLYLLTAYGGASQIWTEASNARPLLLRFGIPTLAAAGRQQFTMSEFGVDRFIVPASPNHFRLELPSAFSAALQVGAYDTHEPYRVQGELATVDKKSLLPVAELDQNGNGERIVSVTMESGKTFTLQHFEARNIYRINSIGDYWLSSIHTGSVEDSVGASAVLTRRPRNAPEEFVAQQVVELDPGAPWHRRFNLLDATTIFVMVPTTAKVRVVGEGVEGHYRFDPFLTSQVNEHLVPSWLQPWTGYQAPDPRALPWQPSGHVFELDKGLYVLRVVPDVKGILDLSLQIDGSPSASGFSPVQGAVRFPSVHFDWGSEYTLYLNNQPGVTSGMVLRSLPIDLSQALAVSQKAGEAITVPVLVPEAGTLRALSENGRSLELTLDDGRHGSSIELVAGTYQVSVGSQDHAVNYSLDLEPVRLSGRTPLPALPDSRLAGIPQFPVISADSPRFVELGRHGSQTFRVQVERPGLYQFQTTGLLGTGGKVRTRVQTALFDASENGVGRNFLIQRYLREGEYQLTVSTVGETRGDLGVQLTHTGEIDGGVLGGGAVARALLPAAHSLAYRFHIAKQGRYHLQTLGLGRNFDVRLEDADGWPVFAPVQKGDLTEVLEPGDYRVLILPQAVEARVLTRLERVVDAKQFVGHGPHRIALESAVQHTWVEPEKGAARQLDQWEFALPAPAEVSLVLDNGMEASLVAATNTARILGAAKPTGVDTASVWHGDLTPGRYLVRAQHGRANNYVSYTLHLSVTQLTPGQSRTVLAPASVPVSVGADGLVEFESFGSSDVRAQLIDAAGETIAQNDDRPGDWNFQIAQRLRPGQYRLKVDPVGDEHAQTTVSMLAPVEVLEPGLKLGAEVDVKDALVHVFPLLLPPDRNALFVSARSEDAIGLALEGESASGWSSLGTVVGKGPHLALPLAPERFKAYRLRAWSADRRSLQLSLRALAVLLPPVAEDQWLLGKATAVTIDERQPTVRMAMIALSRAGTFRLKGDPARLSWSDSGSRAALPCTSPLISTGSKTLWIVADAGGDAVPDSIAAERVRLPSGEQESIRVELLAGQSGLVDLQSNPQGPSIVIAQARSGQPGVGMGLDRDMAAMGFVTGEAIAVGLPGTAGPAGFWNASSATAPLELDVRQVPLRQLAGKPFAYGLNEGILHARTALAAQLPETGVEVHLTLAPMSSAVFLRHGKVLSTHWTGADALQETVTIAEADQLWLLNAGSGDAQFSVEIARSSTESTKTLKPGELLERNVSTAGRLRIRVETPKSGDYNLRVQGNTKAIWQEDSGRIASGEHIAIHGSGVLWLQHGPGTLVAWLDDSQPLALDRIRHWLESLRETNVKAPQSIELDGKQQVLNFQLETITLMHLRTSAPVVTQFLVPGLPARTEAHLYGADVNLLAPAGASRLVLHAVGADAMSGVASVVAMPASVLSEGVGPEVLLGPGAARLFSIDVPAPATVGIGIRASSDVVRSVLYDGRGAAVSEGVVQMPTLAPGHYYLTVEMPADTAPVRLQPIILGLGHADTRPPFDVLRGYVEAKEDSAPLIFVPGQPAAAPEAASPAGAAPEGEATPKEMNGVEPDSSAAPAADERKQ
jgi:hypothetical protein